ncbi:cytochrome P450 [Actinomycetospora atypica]|uniref:Cytochrome P450 n=1 Tax=Actinomycetospora atypica TaxID=1290095 RepID=A0ABV9YHF4_9PSEU
MLEHPLPRPDPITPPPAFDELRRSEPVAQVATAFGPAWLVTSADLAVAALSDDRLGLTPPGAEVDVRASLFQDGPAHARLRRLVAGAFRPARIEALKPGIAALAEEYVERVVAAGPPVDLVDALAAPLPVMVVGELVGIDPARHDEFRKLVDGALAADPMSGDPELAMTAWTALGGFVADLVATKRAAPADDLLSDLVAVRDTDDGRLDDDELVALVQVVLAAGTLTVRNALVQAVVRLLDEDRFGDLGDVAGLVEEVIRRAGTDPFPRFAHGDLELGGAHIAVEEMVLVSLEAANHDPARFAEPHDLRPGRREPHLGFGHGPHFCLGAALARAELVVTLPILARRLPGLRLDVSIADIPWQRGLVDHGPLALPMSW